MTKRQDLNLQRRSRPEQSDQRQPDQAANISHQPRASPNSTALTSRIEFPTMTSSRAWTCRDYREDPSWAHHEKNGREVIGRFGEKGRNARNSSHQAIVRTNLSIILQR